MKFNQLNFFAKVFSILLIVLVSVLFIFIAAISFKPIQINELSYINKNFLTPYGLDVKSMENIFLSFNKFSGNFEIIIEDIKTDDLEISDALLGVSFSDLILGDLRPKIIKIYDAVITIDKDNKIFHEIFSNQVEEKFSKKNRFNLIFSKFEIVEINNSFIKFKDFDLPELKPVDIKIVSVKNNREVSVSIGDFDEEENSLFINISEMEDDFKVMFKSKNFNFSDITKIFNFNMIETDSLKLSSTGFMQIRKDLTIEKFDTSFNARQLKINKLFDSDRMTLLELFKGQINYTNNGSINGEVSFSHNNSKTNLFISDLPEKKKTLLIKTDRIESGNLVKFWPKMFKNSAREWVDRNFNAKLKEIELKFILTESYLLEKFVGNFNFEDGMLNYLNGMPRILDLSGRSEIKDNKITFEINEGFSRKLKLENSTVEIVDLEKPLETAKLKLKISSQIEDLKNYLDESPIRKENFYKLFSIDGSIYSELKMNFPLLKDLDAEEIVFSLDSRLINANVYNFSDNFDLNDVNVDLNLNNEGLYYSGTAVFKDIIFNIEGNENYNDEYETMILDSKIESESLNNIFGKYIDHFSGNMPLNLIYKNDKKLNSHFFTMKADLNSIALEDNFLGLDLNNQLNGELNFKFTLNNNQLTNGSFFIKSNLINVDIKKKNPGKLDNIFLVEKFSSPYQNFSGSIELGQKLNLYLQGQRLSLNLSEIQNTDNSFHNINFNINVEKLFLSNKSVYNPVLKGSIYNSKFENLEFFSRNNDKLHDIKIFTENGEKKLFIMSNDASELISYFKKEVNIKRGELLVDAKKIGDSFVGVIKLSEFVAYDTPLLAKILSIFSIDALDQKLLDDGIFFKKLETDYTFSEDIINLNNGLLKGSELGITFDGKGNIVENFYDIKGTFVPAYTLNTLLTDLPIVGDIITAGSPEEGILAANYKLRTVDGKLDVSFNPISAIVPNIIKNLLD